MMVGVEYESDLVVLVPDQTFAAVVATVLRRSRALRTRLFSHEIYAHPHHDPGCARRSDKFLRAFLPTHAHALVLFDREGCGLEGLSARELEASVTEQLQRSGWEGRAEVVVLDPELEVWAWSDSPRVDECFGWPSRTGPLREWLQAQGVWEPGSQKPRDPKAAVELTLRAVRGGPPAAVLVRLARSVALSRCVDRAFQRLCSVLQRWFPAI